MFRGECFSAPGYGTVNRAEYLAGLLEYFTDGGEFYGGVRIEIHLIFECLCLITKEDDLLSCLMAL